MRWAQRFFLCVLICFSTACSTTTVLPAQQLNAGEFSFGGSADLPGIFMIPRFQGQALYGFGLGDIGAHLGTGLFTSINTGLTFRGYLGDFANLVLDTDVLLPLLENTFDEDGIDGILTSASVRLLTNPGRDGLFYGGLTSSYLGSYTSDGIAPGVISTGFTLGVSSFDAPSKTNIQIELTYRPFGYGLNDGTFSIFPGKLDGGDSAGVILNLLQLSFSMNYFTGPV